jgi:hypothetical protein
MRSARTTNPAISGPRVQIYPPPATFSLSDELVEFPNLLVSPSAHLTLPLKHTGYWVDADRTSSRRLASISRIATGLLAALRQRESAGWGVA